MEKKTGRRKKAEREPIVNTIVFGLGIVIVAIGACYWKSNFLLTLILMPVGLVVMFIGWVLDAYEVGYGNDL